MTNIDKRIQYINTIIFFFGWLIIFLLGADFPPPIGFLWLVLLIVILDIIQFFYLKFLLQKILKQSTFLKNGILFLIAGIILSVTTSIEKVDLKNKIIWISIVTCVSVIYGIAFWIFNKELKKYFIMNGK